jgi:hypothetical protein
MGIQGHKKEQYKGPQVPWSSWEPLNSRPGGMPIPAIFPDQGLRKGSTRGPFPQEPQPLDRLCPDHQRKTTPNSQGSAWEIIWPSDTIEAEWRMSSPRKRPQARIDDAVKKGIRR